MYEDLIKDLRNCFGTDTMFCDCDSCHYKGLVDDHDYSKCVETLGVEAADAIENLCSEMHKRTEELEDATWRNIPQWIPVTERLPYAGKKVLTYERIRGVQVNFCNDDGEWWIGSKVTHWMPLPEPPKVTGND